MATATATYPDALAPVLARALQDYGATAVDDLVTNWLLDRAQVQYEADLAAARSGKADAQVKARLRANLGL